MKLFCLTNIMFFALNLYITGKKHICYIKIYQFTALCIEKMAKHLITDYFVHYYYINNKKSACDLQHVYNWLKLFVYLDKLKIKNLILLKKSLNMLNLNRTIKTVDTISS